MDQLWSGIIELQEIKRNQTAANNTDMLRKASLITEGPRLREESWIFQQDNAAIHNTRKLKEFYGKQDSALEPFTMVSRSKLNQVCLEMDSKKCS